MYTALLDNNMIEEPLYRDNDVKLAWVGHEDWNYTRHFEVSDVLTTAQSVVLVLEGVDTVSTVYINNQQVGTTNNMFVRYTFDIKSAIRPGTNSVFLAFQSATDYASKQAASYPYTVPKVCPSPIQHGECHINFIRKEQCSFSWDWGPSFPTQGIWKPVYLEVFNTTVMDMATVEVVPDERGRGWVLKTKTYFRVSGTDPVIGKLEIKLNGTSVSAQHRVILTATRNWTEVNMPVPRSANVRRWWPNGYGSQPLYDVFFSFTAADGQVTSQRRRIGFRTVVLVQQPVSAVPEQGLTFYFRVNGFPIFLKGSNWIPADSFQERITKDRLRLLLQSAADTHMNAIRINGVGVYESEDFYDLADELGILIWQDLMFCDALYETDQAFLDTVTQEVRHQVRRLMHRPSILLWSANNENEEALRGHWFGTKNYTRYYNDYIKLYVNTILPIVSAENPNRAFVPSCPSNGQDSVREGYVAKDPGSEFYGDIHIYQYTTNLWIPDSSLVPRMATEYGIVAWCNYETLQNVFEESDMNYSSPQAIHRQHHPDGDSQMELEVQFHLDLPSNSTPEPLRFRHWIYLTQINQAMSIKAQSEHYRRHQGALLPDGRGLTMGALYWQLNDIWQAPTWASIDYNGRWKMLHYYALKFFSPILVSPYLNENVLDTYIVVDQIPTKEIRDPHTQRLRMEPMSQFEDILQSSGLEKEDALDLSAKVVQATSGTLYMTMYNWKYFIPLHQWTIPYKLNTTAESVLQRNISDMMTESGCTSRQDCFIYMYLNDPVTGPDNWLYLAELKDSNLQKAQVKIVGLSQDADHEFTVKISTTEIVPFVWLEAKGIMGRFSDNGFLIHKPTVTVKFLAWENVNYITLHSALSVRCLSDVYQ